VVSEEPDQDDLSIPILVSLAASILAGAGCAIGVDRNVADGRSRCEPVIKAVDSYFAAHRRYADRLGELVPRYLPAVPPGFHRDSLRSGIQYYRYPSEKARPETYTFVFIPLMGTPLRCSYSPKTRS
jgi:hypothetical protein